MDPTTAIYQRTASTDAELAMRLRRGDAAAFRTLMQRYNQRLFRMARGVLGDSADAEDAVQEAYVLAFTHIDQFREAASLVTWLSRIVLNEAFRRLRLSAACGHNQRRHRSRPRQIDFKEMAAPTSEEVNHRTRARSTWPLSVICTGMR